MSRLAKAVIVAVAIAAGGYFGLGKLKPAVENLAGQSTSLVQPETKPITYGYTCDLDGKQFFYNLKPNQKPRKEREVVRKQAVEFDLDVGSGSVTLRSGNPAINGKRLRLTSSKVFSEYQYVGMAERPKHESPLIIRDESIVLTLIEGKPISIQIRNWPEDTVMEIGGGMCKPTSADWGEAVSDKMIKAVFIRTCPGQLYAEFESTGKKPVFAKYKKDPNRLAQIKTIPLGNLGAVCKDLKDSGVTDIFIPFKVDHEGKGCGNYGQLLYPSSLYPENVSPIISAAQKIGFDPNGALMKVCEATYGKQALRFHAWFPVFKDTYAAKMGGQKAGAFLRPNFESVVFADPNNPLVKFYELALLDEIAKAYPVVGINLDYIRYASSGEGDILDGYTVQVNPAAVENFVTLVRQRFPKLTLSADVMASVEQRKALGQEVVLEQLDIVMPMEYTKMGVKPGDVDIWINEIKAFHSLRIVPDLRGWIISQTGDGLLSDLAADILDAKTAHAAGYAIFTYESLLNDTKKKGLNTVKDQIRY